MNRQYEAVSEYIEAHKEEMNQTLINLVNLEGRYNEKEHVEQNYGLGKNGPL